MNNTTTAFDKPFGENIIEAGDALYKACAQLNEAISSLEIARNQAATDASVKAIELAQKALTQSHNQLERLQSFDSEVSKLSNLYDEYKQEITEIEIDEDEVF